MIYQIKDLPMSTKPTKRMAFNFLRSYFDVLNKIEDDKQKLDFILAIINKQFLDEEPKGLDFLVDLCYESQRHQIEKSVNGWKTANKTDLQGNPTPPLGSPPTPPKGLPHKEEQVQEEEKEQNNISDFKDVLKRLEYFAKNINPNTSWVIGMYRVHKLKEKNLTYVVKKYIDHALTLPYKNLPKSQTEFQTHCNNWTRIQIDNGKFSEYRTVKAKGSI